jgi:hypothetical protein
VLGVAGSFAVASRQTGGSMIENGRPRLRAMKLHIDDPRIAGMEEGVPFKMGRQA